MLFSSIVFICFFLPIVLIGNYLLSFSRTAQNVLLLIASLFFYAWGEPVYVLIMIFSILMNYCFGLFVDKFDGQKKQQKTVVVISVIMNLGILFVFKYAGFVIRNLNLLFGENLIPEPQLALPIGISFFTFQALSYVIDVYRKDAPVEKNPFYLGLFISFFPQLIAGPIVRYTTVAEQIRNRKMNWNKLCAGTSRFVMGFCKKILLANNFATIADYIFKINFAGESMPVLLAWLGGFAYTLQIFFDFSAYSDMAIGLGLMFGFKFEENFNYPYISKSVTEFWRRWHISLTTWFHEYVYFPLGGSKVKNQDIIVRNIFIVWMLTGIWHGAEWTFILWGMWNFLFIFIEKITEFELNKIPGWIKHIYLLLVTVIGWVLFRAENLGIALDYLKNMFGMTGSGVLSSQALMFVREYWIYWLFGILLCTPFAKQLEKQMVDAKSRIPAILGTVVYPVGLMLLFVISFSFLVRGSYNPFIYFNF